MDLVRVALDVPVDELFDYRLPGAGACHLGRRVVVPFGRGRRVGVILELPATPAVASTRLKFVQHVFEDEPPLADDIVALLRFSAAYYRHPLGQTVLAALPAALRKPRVPRATSATRYTLTDAGRAITPEQLPTRALVKRRLMIAMRQAPCLELGQANAISARAGKALAELVADGLVAEFAPLPAEQAAAPLNAETATGPTLNAEQQRAVGAIAACFGRYAPFVLLGVTGSGKTEVYAALIAQALARGQQSLLLVPEINLTPQLEARLSARFAGVALASLHSGKSEGERVRAFRLAQSGAARIVLGTRLAVFTPLPALGLIVVDEEHDASFKQQEGLRYCARDLAVLRARNCGVPLILGSATPALETFAHALDGSYRLLTLSVRASAPPPSIRCVDARRDRPREGLSGELIHAIRSCNARREQALVFVNRRGYSPALVCRSCGWTAPCTRCSAHLVLHLRDARLRCHYCNHEEPIAAACAACGNQDLAPAGHGTQRVEGALQALFPEARVLRIDRDSTRRRRSFALMRERVHADDVDILVGTQMLAKGHDFPKLTLVGVINADSALFSTDFRAQERLFAQLMQVAGRAGRAGLPGQVLIQTEFPEHPLYRAVLRQDYAAFAREQLDERRRAGFPPFRFQALLRAEARQRETVQAFLEAAAAHGRGTAQNADIYDPVPATVQRVAGRERGYLLVQADSRKSLQAFLDRWHPRLADLAQRRVRWSLDVDPIEL